MLSLPVFLFQRPCRHPVAENICWIRLAHNQAPQLPPTRGNDSGLRLPGTRGGSASGSFRCRAPFTCFPGKRVHAASLQIRGIQAPRVRIPPRGILTRLRVRVSDHDAALPYAGCHERFCRRASFWRDVVARSCSECSIDLKFEVMFFREWMGLPRTGLPC